MESILFLSKRNTKYQLSSNDYNFFCQKILLPTLLLPPTLLLNLIKQFPSYTIISTYTFINLLKNILPTLLFGPTLVFGTLEYESRPIQ